MGRVKIDQYCLTSKSDTQTRIATPRYETAIWRNNMSHGKQDQRAERDPVYALILHAPHNVWNLDYQKALC